MYPVLLPASLTDQEYEAVKSKASFSEWGDWWSLSVGDVMAALDCGNSKAGRIRAQGLARLRREYPHGIPKG